MTKKYRFTIIMEGVPLEGTITGPDGITRRFSHLPDCISDVKQFTQEAIQTMDHWDYDNDPKVISVKAEEIK